MLEVELKLAVEGPFAPALTPERIDVSSVEELGPLDLHATYWDTADLRLARNRVTLRHRTGEGAPRWTLKLPALPRDITARHELHFDGPGRTIPEGALDLVTAFARSAPLSAVARLRTLRRRWSLRGRTGEDLAELVDDRVSVLREGRVVERFREIEIEGRAMDRPGLQRIANVLAEDGATSAAAVPKLVRALGDRAEAPPDGAPAPLSPSDSAGYAVRAAVARGVERLVLHDPPTRLGDVEGLHQMRVAARRLRSDLKTFERLLDPEWSRPLREELRWLGAALGAVRDIDVMQERLSEQAGDLRGDLDPLFEALAHRREPARANLMVALRSARFVDLLDRLVEVVREPVLSELAEMPAADVLPTLARRSWRNLAQVAGALDAASPDAAHHEVRVRAKQARYAAEAVAAALAPKQARHAKRFAKRAAEVQGVLGTLQDTVVARATIAAAAESRPGDGRFNLAAGRMLEREVQAGEQARHDFPAAWDRLREPKVRRWLKS
jgi:CHAD domain-containing protein